MTEFKLPRSTLEKLPTATLKGVMTALLEEADNDGVLTISIREFAKKIGLEYQPLRTALKYIYTNAMANAIATQRLTQITISNIDSYSIPARKQQRKANAMANAVSDKQKPTKFSPPTDADVEAYVLEKGYHFNPAQFVPYYEKQGWKQANGQPIKDWKAACRYWEAQWKEKHGERYYYQVQQSATRSRGGLADLREAAGTILRQPGNLDTYFNDRG